MPLQKISEFDQDYRNTLEGNDIKGMGVYVQGTDEKIGTVNDAVLDDQGAFRYLIVDIGFWIFGKKILLPVGKSRIDSTANRVYVVGITREQAENLPEYQEHTTLDYDYEEQVRGRYRTPSVESSATLGSTVGRTTPSPDSYTYADDADLYDVSAHEDQTFKLYQERLVANKQRRKSGEVSINKHVETETARVAVPVEKERVVIERVTSQDTGKVVSAEATDFSEGEVAHIDLYEEVPDIRKEAFLREEVKVQKVVDKETVEAQETIRREELDVDTDGTRIENKIDRG
ncbi:MAG: DUF2382 domain-containing protein [Nostoc sp. DedQUE08]|uniref:DUF2382 domain-containing protein n=1 Tax=unclassified Nostoc TaxID=2593658 RepID=UPI002AD3749C|nr:MULTISPECIES: DUF2382 domain-containing protein [unclassified Nostoc]MDZ8031935.1 DUF2382 domain-containing protein [Nostoc sp. DedSLP04]MDZ8070545.1 DUF2382 domain-containing protein [Nostoc sp. DedQUE08]MDZ8096758.1 DUF2382 domain-containing protein [Nostoc sp. DedQUE05]